MNNLSGKIEALLFATAKPMSVRMLAKVLSSGEEVIREALDVLRLKRNVEDSGIFLLEHAGEVSLVSNPVFADVLMQMVSTDATSELTRPSLETLTIIAYRGPMTKPEIEQIRGVNCSLILRNLQIRDLIIETMNTEKLQPVYEVSQTFLRHLGLTSLAELPSFEAYHHNEDIDRLLQQLNSSEEV